MPFCEVCQRETANPPLCHLTLRSGLAVVAAVHPEVTSGDWETSYLGPGGVDTDEVVERATHQVLATLERRGYIPSVASSSVAPKEADPEPLTLSDEEKSRLLSAVDALDQEVFLWRRTLEANPSSLVSTQEDFRGRVVVRLAGITEFLWSIRGPGVAKTEWERILLDPLQEEPGDVERSDG